MSDFTAIRDAMRPQTQGLRLGVVEKVLDPARLVVRFSSGALRRVYVNGNAMPAVGTDVLCARRGPCGARARRQTHNHDHRLRRAESEEKKASGGLRDKASGGSRTF